MHKELICIGILCCLLFPLHGYAQSGSTQHAAEDLLYEIIDSQGHEAAIRKYRELKKQPSARYDVSESVLNRLGYRLLQESKYDDALAIFKDECGNPSRFRQRMGQSCGGQFYCR